jgi:hypothetical protein
MNSLRFLTVKCISYHRMAQIGGSSNTVQARPHSFSGKHRDSCAVLRGNLGACETFTSAYYLLHMALITVVSFGLTPHLASGRPGTLAVCAGACQCRHNNELAV